MQLISKNVMSLLLFSICLLGREYGPPVGAEMPNFELQDQTGKRQSLKNVLGPKGALIVFFRSADW
jgi:hypothetical protein